MKWIKKLSDGNLRQRTIIKALSELRKNIKLGKFKCFKKATVTQSTMNRELLHLKHDMKLDHSLFQIDYFKFR